MGVLYSFLTILCNIATDGSIRRSGGIAYNRTFIGVIFITELPFEYFYLSAVTPLGTVSRTGQLLLSDEFSKVVLLKGGTTMLHSELLKSAADEAAKRGLKVKIALSAADDSLIEAVFWNDTAVADGSFPFDIEPPFFGCKLRPMWLGDAVNWQKASEKREALEAAYSECGRLFEAARKLLFAADCLLSDNRRTAFFTADRANAERQAAKTADGSIIGKGDEKFFITAGRYCKSGISGSLSDYEATAFNDRYGGCAELFLSLIRKEAKRKKCAFYTGFSPLYPYAFPEVLIFPDSKKAIFHAEGCFKLDRMPDRVMTADSFYDNRQLLSLSRQLAANQKAAQKLLCRSEELFLQAAATRNKISRIAVGGNAADGRLLEQPRRRLFDMIF